MENDALIRLVSERELHTSREIQLDVEGASLVFTLTTIPAELKRQVRTEFDARFPVPPVITHKTPVGNVARFNLEDEGYKLQLDRWHESLSYGVLAATLGLTVDDVHLLETLLPSAFMVELFTTAELINGIQSEPLADLIRDAMWAPEVLAWMDTYKPKGDEIQISDKPLFGQMEAMIAAGMTFEDWDRLTPRERMLVMSWHSYKGIREAYINWWTLQRNTHVESRNPMRQMMGA